MKLNYKRTILVGFAFFLISLFWQAYDTNIPLILNNKFGMSQGWSGAIMTLDNILALFMLPLFGALSDKCRNKMGRRTPFILVGTIFAVIAIVAMTFVDNAQLKKIEAVSVVDDVHALETIYDSQSGKTITDPDGNKFQIQEVFSKEEFTSLRSSDPEIDPAEGSKNTTMSNYTRYVVPTRQAYIWQITAAAPATLVTFVVILLILLVSMAIFRSPAVALMPDVTIKPLRSKGNAIINLMGAAGGCLTLLLGIILKTGKAYNVMMSYMSFFLIVAIIMILSLVIFMLFVKEKKWAAEMEQDTIRFGIEEKTESQDVRRRLTRSELVSLILVLASVFLWYFGYNAATTKYSIYAATILRKDHNLTLIIAQAAAIVAYLPVGMVASKIGRKKTILAGVVMLAVAFGAAALMNSGSPTIVLNILFALAGIGWATINVNSFPMVVEMCSGGNVGKYTGYYYTASMAAQALTPTISGILMDNMGMTVLFPYAAIFVALAFVTMFFVKHGDAKPEAKKGLEALDTED